MKKDLTNQYCIYILCSDRNKKTLDMQDKLFFWRDCQLVFLDIQQMHVDFKTAHAT